MQVNLSTFSADLASAHKEILSSSSQNNWALFGYDKAGNDLKPISKGDGGLEELRDEFDGSKIQFAFCRVIDSNHSLPKFVFISWCGDGVPIGKKGLFSSHLQDVRNFFKGFHVEITARGEDDVDPGVIMKKVRDSTGAKYSHVQTDLAVRKDIVETKSPTSAKAEDPVAKIRKEREEMEKQLMEREKTRQKNEAANVTTIDATQKLRQEREQAEKELMERERQNEKNRQDKPAVSAKPFRPTPPPTAAKPAPQPDTRSSENADSSSDTVASAVPQVVSEQARKVRNVWAEREKSASSENVSASPKSSRTDLSQTVTPPQRPAVAQRSQQPRVDNEAELRAKRAAEDQRQQALERERIAAEERERERQAADDEQRAREQQRQEEQRRRQEEIERKKQAEAAAASKRQQQEQEQRMRKEQEEAAKRAAHEAELERQRQEIEAVNLHQEHLLTARAIFDYEAVESNEMSLADGDIVTDIIQVDTNWWQGNVKDHSGYITKEGLFPANYVEVIPDRSNKPAAHSSSGNAQAGEEKGISARALYDYQASEDNEINLVEGDIVSDIVMVDDGWWQGVVYDGDGRALKAGLFPANYVEVLQ